MNITHTIRNLYRKLTTGVGCCDMANYKDYIAEKLAKDLTVFKEKTISFPSYPSDMTYKKWIQTLDKMIEGFSLAAEDKWEYTKEDEDKMEKAGELFGKYWQDLWI